MNCLKFSVWFLALAVMCLSASAQAGINKCIGADGKVVFSDQACSAGQTSTQIKGAAKPGVPSSKQTADTEPNKQMDMGSNVLVYDQLCAEDQRLFDRDARKLNPDDRQLRKARLDKRCNSQARLEAIESDKKNLVEVCKIKRDELQNTKKLPPRPAGYADRSQEIAASEGWLKANCK
jgi:Domain of unknown function (DUF4124)